MRSKLTLFTSVAAFAASAFIMFGASPAGAWSTNQSASSACVDGTAVVNASFTNTEPASSSDNESDDDQSDDNKSGDDTGKDGKESESESSGSNDMIVTASLGKLDLGTKTVMAGATANWTYNSGKPDLTMVTAISNTVTFKLTWADGRTGTDYRSATFSDINCAPPTPSSATGQFSHSCQNDVDTYSVNVTVSGPEQTMYAHYFLLRNGTPIDSNPTPNGQMAWQNGAVRLFTPVDIAAQAGDVVQLDLVVGDTNVASATFTIVSCVPAPTTPTTPAPTTPTTPAPTTTTTVATSTPPVSTTVPREVGHTGGSSGSRPSGTGLALAAFGLIMLLWSLAPSRKTIPVKK
jgi:hypothetical protein